MIFNQSNITNRTVLARCCFADMVIDMMEARTIGDTDTYECKKRKAMFLNYAIGEMCDYVSDKLFYINAGSWGHVEEQNMTLNASAGAVVVTYMRFVKDDDPTQYVELVTPGFSFTATGSGTADMDAVIAEINSYEDPLWDNIIVTAQRDAVSNKFRFIVEADISFWNGYKLQISATAGFTISSAVPAEIVNGYYLPAPICFTDDTARKFINQMDDLCGCPCGCSAAKILDDNLPKYI
jgi:hypothetical protein